MNRSQESHWQDKTIHWGVDRFETNLIYEQ